MDTKKVILDAATKLFFDKGLDFTMDSLATNLKMSKRTIYSFVGNKEIIIMEIIENLINSFNEYYQSVCENDNISYLDKFELLLNYPNDSIFLTRKHIKELQESNQQIYEKFQSLFNYFWEKCFEFLDIYNDHINATIHCNKEIFRIIYDTVILELVEKKKADPDFNFKQNQKFVITNLISGIVSTDSSRFGGILLQRMLGRFKIGTVLFNVDKNINSLFISPGFDDTFEVLQQNELFNKYINEFNKTCYDSSMEDSFLERNVISFDFDKVDKSTIYNYNFKAIPIRYENYKNVFLSIITDTTDTRNREVALKISEEKFNLALEQTSVDIWELDIVDNYLYLSDAFANRYGYATTSFKLGIGMFSQYNIIHKDYTKKLEEFYLNILAGKKSGECKIKMLDKFKRYQLVKLSYKTIFDNNNNPITAVGVATIVNTNLGVYTMFNQEEKIANILKNQLLFSAQYNITDGVVKNIVGKENFISTYLHDKLTYDKIFNIILNTVAHEVDYQECENILSEDNLINSIANNKYYQTINYRRVNEKGIISWVTLTLVFLVEPTSGDEYVFIYILDTDKKYKLELSLPVKAEYDVTTKIYIKDTMKRLTNFAINSEETSDNDCAFVIFELNNLPTIKFQYGLDVAEKLLAHYSRVLRVCFGSKEIVGRVKDNQIAVFMPVVDDLSLLKNQIADVIAMAHDSYVLSNEEQRIAKISTSIFVSNLKIANFLYLNEMCSKQLENLKLMVDETIDYIDNIEEYINQDKNQLESSMNSESDSMCSETKEMLGCLMDTFNKVSTFTDSKKIIQEIMKRANSCFSSYRTSIFLLENDNETMTLTFEETMGESSEHDNVSYNINDIPCFKASYLSKNIEIVKCEDMKNCDINYYNFLRKNNINLLYVLPLVYKTKVLGFIAISNPIDHLDGYNLLKVSSSIIVNELVISNLEKENKKHGQIDFLTQIYNYRVFRKYINKYKQNALNSFGIACLKITNLRNINLQQGTEYGDVIIKSIAKTLLTNFSFDTVFKINSDVFEVIAIDLNYKTFTEKVNLAVKEINSISPNLVSLGLTWADSDIDIENMIVNAEEIMQINSNENNIKIMESNNDETLNKLYEAMDKKWFTCYLQPKVDLKTDKVVSAESLIRLVHPTYGLISPASIIPVLEKYNLVSVVDYHVLDLVCYTIKNWEERGIKPIPISVNYSRVTLLDNRVVEKTLEIIDKYNIDKSLIEIEITESIGNIEQKIIAELANKFIDNGITLALDDFGSEFSSLSTLANVTFDEVKIDKSVINNLTVNTRSQVIVESVIQTCKKLNMVCVAEGIETESQKDEIKRLGCDLGQGYFFSKPIPVADFEEKYFKK